MLAYKSLPCKNPSKCPHVIKGYAEFTSHCPPEHPPKCSHVIDGTKDDTTRCWYFHNETERGCPHFSRGGCRSGNACKFKHYTANVYEHISGTVVMGVEKDIDKASTDKVELEKDVKRLNQILSDFRITRENEERVQKDLDASRKILLITQQNIAKLETEKSDLLRATALYKARDVMRKELMCNVTYDIDKWKCIEATLQSTADDFSVDVIRSQLPAIPKTKNLSELGMQQIIAIEKTLQHCEQRCKKTQKDVSLYHQKLQLALQRTRNVIAKGASSLTGLPRDAMLMILSVADAQTRGRMAQTCKSIRDMQKDPRNFPHLRHRYILKENETTQLHIGLYMKSSGDMSTSLSLPTPNGPLILKRRKYSKETNSDVWVTQISATLHEGMFVGPYNEYYSGGTQVCLANFERGMLVGDYLEYHNNGKLHAHVIFENNLVLSARKYGRDGVAKPPIMIEHWTARNYTSWKQKLPLCMSYFSLVDHVRGYVPEIKFNMFGLRDLSRYNCMWDEGQ